MFKAKLGVSQWVTLPDTIRRRIAELFNLESSGSALVETNSRGQFVLKHDRHTEKDLEALTIEKMSVLTGCKSESYFEQFEKVLEYVENETVGKAKKAAIEKEQQDEKAQQIAARTAMETIEAISEAARPILKKRGRPKK